MTPISCDLCGNEFEKWPEVSLKPTDTWTSGDMSFLRYWYVTDIHLHHKCFLSLGFNRYYRAAAEKAGISP